MRVALALARALISAAVGSRRCRWVIYLFPPASSVTSLFIFPRTPFSAAYRYSFMYLRTPSPDAPAHCDEDDGFWVYLSPTTPPPPPPPPGISIPARPPPSPTPTTTQHHLLSAVGTVLFGSLFKKEKKKCWKNKEPSGCHSDGCMRSWVEFELGELLSLTHSLCLSSPLLLKNNNNFKNVLELCSNHGRQIFHCWNSLKNAKVHSF